MAHQTANLLPVGYYHLIFTVPEPLRILFRYNERVLYDALFQAAAQTLKEFFVQDRRLGVVPAFFAVLHTWGGQLQ